MSNKILVLGADGQLGLMFRDIAFDYDDNFIFANRLYCDITDIDAVKSLIHDIKPSVIVNCAAYTAVDKAEVEVEKAYLINADTIQTIATVASDVNALFIHFSSDYVYHIDTNIPLKETDICMPVGEYAKSKKLGEDHLLDSECDYIIIRTSWLYSEYGNNFMKTMLKLAETKNELSIVNDQIGCPTYTRDLANITMDLISKGIRNQIYNFANAGITSWYDFANEIFKQTHTDIKINPIPSSGYPTPAERPKWSVMDLSKIEQDTNQKCKDWKSSLKDCLSRMN